MNTELNTELNTPTPRTDAATALTSQHRYDDSFGDPEFGWVTAGFARTLERELVKANAILASIEEDGTEEHNAAVGLRRELAVEREKVRLLRDACDQICDEWGRNHDTNPIGAGQRMATRAGKALEATEGVA